MLVLGNPLSIRFYAIVGVGGSGKSSIIRALTGVGNISRIPGGVSERWKIGYHSNGQQQTFVQGCSLQEVKFQPSDFIIQVMGATSKLVIVAMQPNSSVHKGKTYPDAQTYVDAFVTAGWIFSGHATVGNVQALQGSLIPVVLTDRVTSPANQEASKLRQMWGIL